MSETLIPTMVVDAVELRSRPGFVGDPIDCGHLWEPHLWDTGRAYCPRCGSFARWLDDPRVKESS